MKTCQTCNWCRFNQDSPDLSECTAPQSYRVSLITGKPSHQDIKFCENLRKEPGYHGARCGQEGKWWKEKEVVPQKESFLQKLFKPW